PSQHCRKAKDCGGGICLNESYCTNLPSHVCSNNRDCAPQADEEPHDGIGDFCESGWRLACYTGSHAGTPSWLDTLGDFSFQSLCDPYYTDPPGFPVLCSGVLTVQGLRPDIAVRQDVPTNYARAQLVY